MSNDTSQARLPVHGDFIKDCIGSIAPDIVLYIGNRPEFSVDFCGENVLSVPELISLNGNHWRKIFTIFEKLTSSDANWRVYRDRFLLHHREAICFSNKLVDSATIHLVAGKASWAHLELDMNEFQPLDAEQRVWIKGNMICTPYFDYRQFPNALIDLVHQHMHKLLEKHKS